MLYVHKLQCGLARTITPNIPVTYLYTAAGGGGGASGSRWICGIVRSSALCLLYAHTYVHNVCLCLCACATAMILIYYMKFLHTAIPGPLHVFYWKILLSSTKNVWQNDK